MITKPVLTEKSFGLTALDRYTFKVDPKATKHQVKEAVEKLFKVNVVGVTTLKAKTRSTRSPKTGKHTQDRGFKKAFVKLKPGQKINFFNT